MILLTETFLDGNILDSEIVSGPYLVFRKDRNRHGGGVMLIIRDNIPVVRRNDLETDCELLWVEITASSRQYLIGVVYCPPGSHKKSLHELEFSLSGIPSHISIVIGGDFYTVLPRSLNVY